jgi:hypothetical protein
MQTDRATIESIGCRPSRGRGEKRDVGSAQASIRPTPESWREPTPTWRGSWGRTAHQGGIKRHRRERQQDIVTPDGGSSAIRGVLRCRRTPNAERRTPNAERRTPNAERRTPNAERRTPNISDEQRERTTRAASTGARAGRQRRCAGAIRRMASAGGAIKAA